MADREKRLRASRLYLVCDEQPERFLLAALRGGVDIVQLRMKAADDERVLAAARRFADVCSAHDALFILNDRPDLVDASGADGVHVGQEDMPVAEARRIVGPDRLVGLSTHDPQQIDAAAAYERRDRSDPGGPREVDYIGVGPVFETPTKPGRQPVGLELLRYAAEHVEMPFFAIGGIDPTNVDAVHAAGATRVAVVRALTQAPDPEAAARCMRRALIEQEAGVGSA